MPDDLALVSCDCVYVSFSVVRKFGRILGGIYASPSKFARNGTQHLGSYKTVSRVVKVGGKSRHWVGDCSLGLETPGALQVWWLAGRG